MIYLILKSYLSLFLSIGIGALTILMIGCYFIFKKSSPSTDKDFTVKQFNINTNKESVVNPHLFIEEAPNLIEDISSETIPNIDSIAGEDHIATQLDLARAYIELGSRQLAKKILDDIVVKGDALQQNEARTLLGLI